MEKAEKIVKLRELLAPVIESHGAFLVDVNVRSDGKREQLEVFCETDTGITIDECAKISREILPVLDGASIFGNNLRIDVSSPGIGSPIRERRQYKRNIGKLVSVRFRDADEVREVEGELTGLSDDGIVVKGPAGQIEIGFNSIVEARVKIRW